MLKSLLPIGVKINITNDDIRLKSTLTTNKTIRFTKRKFFYTILGFTQSHLGLQGYIYGFFQLIPGLYKSYKPGNITGIDKVHLKCDCIQGSLVNGIREPISYSFALSLPPGHKVFKTPRKLIIQKMNKSVLSHTKFYFQDDVGKPTDFNEKTIRFTCQVIKIKQMNETRYDSS